MGNWRTVNMMGAIPLRHIESMKEYFVCGDSYDNFNCLSIAGGLCGLNWISPQVSAIGNLAERDYTPNDVVDILMLIAEKWPGVELKIHCGDDWEKLNCIATVILKDGKVKKLEPQVKEIMGIPHNQVAGNFISALTGK